jgi:predicted membrane channel-forming protein YqfA (hemolysin III family)
MKTLMKTLHVILFAGMLIIALIGVLVEVINPHSFLNSTGAFLRAAGFILVVPLWAWFSKRVNHKLLIPGILILTISGITYFISGVSLRKEAYLYEESRAKDPGYRK